MVQRLVSILLGESETNNEPYSSHSLKVVRA